MYVTYTCTFMCLYISHTNNMWLITWYQLLKFNSPLHPHPLNQLLSAFVAFLQFARSQSENEWVNCVLPYLVYSSEKPVSFSVVWTDNTCIWRLYTMCQMQIIKMWIRQYALGTKFLLLDIVVSFFLFLFYLFILLVLFRQCLLESAFLKQLYTVFLGKSPTLSNLSFSIGVDPKFRGFLAPSFFVYPVLMTDIYL